jgi:hypothetical protein
MARWRSTRQRRAAVRRGRDQALRAEAREHIEAARARQRTGADLLAIRYGAYVHDVPSRAGHAVEAIGDGWRVTGPLDEVRAELEHRVTRLSARA